MNSSNLIKPSLSSSNFAKVESKSLSGISSPAAAQAALNEFLSNCPDLLLSKCLKVSKKS